MGTQIIPASKLRSRIMKIVRELEAAPERYIITRNGEAAAALISYEEYRSLLATMEVLSDPVLMRRIRQGKKDETEGRLYSFDEVFGEPL
ncbi:MAG: type II toxin-antitoxin system Phd/YefM family antitoxin [bacterium]